MEGLRVGPVRTQLFRSTLTSFEEAVNVALAEDVSQRRSVIIGSQGGATPMDLGAVDVPGYQNSVQKCYNCGIRGHYSRDCRKPRAQQSGGGSKKGLFRGKMPANRSNVHQRTPRFPRQGNEGTR